MNKPQLNETDSVLVIYHANCHDGHMAAFTIWLELGDAPNIIYLPTQHYTEPPNVTGKIVYILDFCYPHDTLQYMIEQAKALLVIDHHKTSRETLQKIASRYKIFNEKECASTLTWQYLRPEEKLPKLYQYIRSRDIWTQDMPYTNAFSTAFDLAIRGPDGQFSFELTRKFLNDDEIKELITIGKTVQMYQESVIDKALKNAFFSPVRLPDNRLIIVAYINTTTLTSEIGNKCMQAYPFVDLCACYWIDSVRQETRFSLRSIDSKEDVSVIAKDHGGGGHPNAAGCGLKKLACRLNYEHLNSIPLSCIIQDRPLRLDQDNLNLFTPEYLQLLKDKFPGKSLNIELSLNDVPVNAALLSPQRM